MDLTEMSLDRTHEIREIEVLLEEGMRRERTPPELLAWVDTTHRRLADTEEDRKRVRLQKGHIKLLLEEVRPLALFGVWLAQEYPDLTIQPLAGKELPYDGILRSAGWTTEQKVEVSFATDGHQEHLRMLHLNEFGRAPAVAKSRTSEPEGRQI